MLDIKKIQSTNTVTIIGDTAYPILFPDGTAININTLIANRPTFVKYNNNNFYLILDKSQVGLSNVDNTSDIDKPISTATQNALNLKLNQSKRYFQPPH